MHSWCSRSMRWRRLCQPCQMSSCETRQKSSAGVWLPLSGQLPQTLSWPGSPHLLHLRVRPLHAVSVRSVRAWAACHLELIAGRPQQGSRVSTQTLDDILPEAFAVVREAARRALGMRHHDVQLVSSYLIHAWLSPS